MGKHDQLICYLATLGAIVVLAMAAMAFTTFSPHVADKAEALGIGMVLGGLIGALRNPSRSQVTVDNPDDKPVPVEAAS